MTLRSSGGPTVDSADPVETVPRRKLPRRTLIVLVACVVTIPVLRPDEPGKAGSEVLGAVENALCRGQCLRLVGHPVSVEVHAAERPGDGTGGRGDAAAHGGRGAADPASGRLRGALEREQRAVGLVTLIRRLLDLDGQVVRECFGSRRERALSRDD